MSRGPHRPGVARILNQRGLRTGAGEDFDPVRVRWVRFAAKLPSLEDRLRTVGWVTRKTIARELAIGRTTLGRMRRKGHIQARICNDHGQWLYWPPGRPGPECAEAPLAAHVTVTAAGMDDSTARGAV